MFGKPIRPDLPAEYYKPLADYRDPYYFTRTSLFKRRGKLIVSTLIVVAASLGVTALGKQRPRIYRSRPVSVKHASIDQHCEACHTTSFGTVDRILRFDDGVRSVTDDACKTCHDGPAHNINQRETIACAHCHREHRGNIDLKRVASQECTGCHADLRRHTIVRVNRKADTPVVRDVTAFVLEGQPPGHPEFALWSRSGTAVDPGTVRLNHKKHLIAGGLPVAGGKDREILTCANCHQPDSQHRYMKPISYNDHCARCHPLSFAIESFSRQLLNVPAHHPTKGETPVAVRGDARERIIAFLRDNPEELKGREATPNRLIPGRPLAQEPKTQAEWDLVRKHLANAEHLLFDGAQGCRYCHQETGREKDGLPRLAPPTIKSRWFDHASFSHDSHRNVDCSKCHEGVEKSEQSADVLMPRLADCTSCHAPKIDSARGDCVECHHYHDRTQERWGPDSYRHLQKNPIPHVLNSTRPRSSSQPVKLTVPKALLSEEARVGDR